MLYVGVLLVLCFFFFFKQKTAYDMRISDWSSDVCSSDLLKAIVARGGEQQLQGSGGGMIDVANIEAAPSVDTNQTMGLQQLAAPEQQSASPQQQQPGVGMASDPTVLQQGGASSPVQNPQQHGGLMGAAQPDQPADPATGMAHVQNRRTASRARGWQD